jgi:hypothetical protein
MIYRNLFRVSLAALLAVLPSVSLAQAPTGAISGQATKQFAPHYDDYTVQLRNVSSGQAVNSKPLDKNGKFSFTNLQLNQRYLVEIYETTPMRLICTEGPFTLDFYKMKEKTDVMIGCGKSPALAWLLVASAGTLAATSITTASASR